MNARSNYDEGWLKGKRIHMELLEGQGEVTYDGTKFSDIYVPTISLFFDNPVKVYKNYLAYSNEGTGINSYILNPGIEFAKYVETLIKAGVKEEAILWGFLSSPIIVKSPSDIQKDKEAMNKAAVFSLWISGDDNTIKQIAKTIHSIGELRLHNTDSGNTFITGKADEEALTAYIKGLK